VRLTTSIPKNPEQTLSHVDTLRLWLTESAVTERKTHEGTGCSYITALLLYIYGV
jgi:hypothetical protein